MARGTAKRGTGGAKPASRERPAPIIIGGCPRSGTTLLRLMLDSHPRIACGPELKVVNLVAGNMVRMQRVHGAMLASIFGVDQERLAETFGDQVVALLEPYRQRQGKPRIAEKTPQNVHVLAHLAWMLPRSPLIHLVRDGRDVARSLMQQRWIDPATGAPLPYNTDLAEAARYWAKCVTDGRAARQGPGASRYLEVRYEDLVGNPEATMKELLRFCGEPWDERVLRYHEIEHDFPESERPSHGDDQSRPVYTSAVGKWRDAWSEAEREVFRREAGALLVELGYERDLDW